MVLISKNQLSLTAIDIIRLAPLFSDQAMQRAVENDVHDLGHMILLLQ
jgi:hypothetical protein